MAAFGENSFRVGMTKYKRKRRCPPMSSTAGSNRGKAPKLVSYCPVCPAEHQSRPESHPHATVSMFAKKASCMRGHVWEIKN